MSSDESLKELKKISKILLLVNAQVVEKELTKIATSDDRKKMWVLMNGERMPVSIAKEAGVTPMAVSYFLNSCVAAQLVEYKRGEPPKRILDYVPPSWIELVKTIMPEETKETSKGKVEEH